MRLRDWFHAGRLFSMLMMYRSWFCPLLNNKIVRERAQSSNTLDTIVGFCTCGGSHCATNSPCLLTHWPNETQLHYREAWRFSSASLSSVIRHINARNRWFNLENSGMVVFNVWAVLDHRSADNGQHGHRCLQEWVYKHLKRHFYLAEASLDVNELLFFCPDRTVANDMFFFRHKESKSASRRSP